ncbi:hypothetical protein GGS20DRAFT_377731 [Poronia punctata]|nr:hypothetical protein GGS20DRAFT_377731 [Poronia punctata]
MSLPNTYYDSIAWDTCIQKTRAWSHCFEHTYLLCIVLLSSWRLFIAPNPKEVASGLPLISSFFPLSSLSQSFAACVITISTINYLVIILENLKQNARHVDHLLSHTASLGSTTHLYLNLYSSNVGNRTAFDCWPTKLIILRTSPPFLFRQGLLPGRSPSSCRIGLSSCPMCSAT